MSDVQELSNQLTGRNGERTPIGREAKAETPAAQTGLATAVNKDMATLYGKMAQVMGEVGSVAREGTNSYFKYKFQRSDDVYNAVRTAMAAQKIAFIANMIEVHQEPMQTKQGTQILTRATFQFTLACGDSGATLTSLWQAEATDTSDKGINKVATAATKYFLLKTFLIGDPGETDPDAESPERHVTTPAKSSVETSQPEAAPDSTPETPKTGYSVGVVINRTNFMYDNINHCKNSINGMIKRGEITPDDNDTSAAWKVFEHRAASDPYKMDMEAVYKALSVAMEADGSAVPVGSIKQWVTEGKTMEKAWEAVTTYHENAKLDPAKAGKKSEGTSAAQINDILEEAIYQERIIDSDQDVIPF